MHFNSIVSVAIVAAANAPFAAAAKCAAVGWLRDNTIWGGPGAPTVAGSQGIHFFKDDKKIHEWKQCDKCSGVCTDYKAVEVPDLPHKVEWASSCSNGAFSECHGAYGDQTHFDGEEPKSGSDFYGLGVSSQSECRIEFDC